MALRRVLVVNKTFPAVGVELLKNRVDIDIVSHTDDEANSLPEIKKRIKGTHGLIWNTKHHLTEEILDIAGPQLKCVSTMSSGIDQIDEEALKRRGIPLGNVPTVLDDAVADIAVGVLIAAARRFKEGVAELETGQWKYGVNWMLGQDISNSTVGVIGLGGIGQAIVRRLKGFNVARFIYTGRRDKPEAQTLGVARVTLDALLKDSDYVILACPLTSETKHLINAETLSIMKSNAVLVNIARGGVVDQDALYNALKSNQIFAAGLDTVTPEPIGKDHPLVGLPNCYILPHLGSATIGTRNAMSQISASNVLLGLDGKPMQCPVF